MRGGIIAGKARQKLGRGSSVRLRRSRRAGHRESARRRRAPGRIDHRLLDRQCGNRMSGSGQAAKATNQIMCAGIIQAVAEAMAFARAQGLPLDKLVDTLSKGAGSSWYFVHRAPNMIRNSFPPGFRVRLHAKDLGICHDMAARFGVQLPVVERMLGEYAELMARGYGDEDISAAFRLKAELFPP